jgi:hypothetical protein
MKRLGSMDRLSPEVGVRDSRIATEPGIADPWFFANREPAYRGQRQAGFSSRNPSGGSLSSSDCGWPCAGMGSEKITPALP